MRAAVYARVSTSNHGQDPAGQLREIGEYCQAPRLDRNVRVCGRRDLRDEREAAGARSADGRRAPPPIRRGGVLAL